MLSRIFTCNSLVMVLNYVIAGLGKVLMSFHIFQNFQAQLD